MKVATILALVGLAAADLAYFCSEANGAGFCGAEYSTGCTGIVYGSDLLPSVGSVKTTVPCTFYTGTGCTGASWTSTGGNAFENVDASNSAFRAFKCSDGF
ncbi:hypothetical protein GQ53DRAFT_769700 [Thozetella sp. PMI_491]|nr:hypothetical protein GQ53DRAFT_769700 [Thozetella sp. PMI_491]